MCFHENAACTNLLVQLLRLGKGLLCGQITFLKLQLQLLKLRLKFPHSSVVDGKRAGADRVCLLNLYRTHARTANLGFLHVSFKKNNRSSCKLKL